MSTKAQTQAAERIGYQRGYAAGRRRAAVDDRQAFRREVFLVALPAALGGNWEQGGKAITSSDDRIDLAWRIADAAMKRAGL